MTKQTDLREKIAKVVFDKEGIVLLPSALDAILEVFKEFIRTTRPNKIGSGLYWDGILDYEYDLIHQLGGKE